MAVFADERVAISGADVVSSGQTYVVANSERLRVELINFTLTTSASLGSRNPSVSFFEPSGNEIAAIPDLNDVSPLQTVTYTFGIGLAAFCGSATPFEDIQNTLPDTVLEPGSAIGLTSKNASTGAVFSGDAFAFVMIYGVSLPVGLLADVIPLLTPLQLAGQLA